MKATIKDVARVASVSPSTVSRALHDNPRISASMRQRIKEIAKELDFHPNLMARGLVSRQPRIVGVLFPGSAASSMGHPFYPAVLRGLGRVAGEKRYHMLLSTGSDSMDAEQAMQDLADSGFVSGIVVLAAQEGPMDELLLSLGLPVVEIGHPQNAEKRFYVDNDNVLAGYTATKYLVERGHRNVLFLGYDARFFVTVDRLRGYQKALNEAGVGTREPWIVPSRFIENTTDSELLSHIFNSSERPTAVVSMDDNLTIALIGFLASRGLGVPADVSVISFNNTQVGQYNTPALTSIDVDPERLGAKAMHLLLDVIKGRVQTPEHQEVPFQLVERDTVATLKG